MIIASIPSPSSGAIHIGPLAIHAYGLMIALGVLAGVWLAGRRLEASKAGTREDMSAIAVWAVIAGVIGSRLYHVITDFELFRHDLLRIFKIWEGGLGIPGGLIGGITVGVIVARRRGVPVGPLLTAAAPALPLSQAIGRIGNWFNQELFGRATTLPWGLRIDDAHLPAGYAHGTLFQPTFLYEVLWNLALCGVLLLIDHRIRLRPGRLLAVYVLGYATGRFWIEGLRIDFAHSGGGLRLNQWVALIAGIGAIAYLVVDALQHRNDTLAVQPERSDVSEELDELDEPVPVVDEMAGDEGIEAGPEVEAPVDPAVDPDADYVAPDE